MLNLILLQTEAATGAAGYLNDGAAKYIGLAVLVIGAALVIFLKRRKVEKAANDLHDKVNARIEKAKDRLK